MQAERVLVRRVPPGTSFAAGVIAGVVMTILLYLIRLAGWTSLDIPMIWGAWITRVPGPGTWWVGLLIHLLISGAVALAYASGFRRVKRSGVQQGLWFACLHWVAAGLFFGTLADLHPVVPERIPDPGLFALSHGGVTALALFATHLIYGCIVGAIHRSTAEANKMVVHRGPLPSRGSY